MTLEALIEHLRAQIRDALATRATHEQTITTIRAQIGDAGAPTQEQSTELRGAGQAITGIDAAIATLRAQEAERVDEQARDAAAAALRRELMPVPTQRTPTTVTGEERTYTRHKDSRGECSFFVDSYRSMLMGDAGARTRLERHATELRREGELTERALSTGGLAGLVVPQYLVDLATLTLRTGRPVANACVPLPLPEQGMTLSIPRGTTGAAVGSQATEHTALTSVDEVWANLNIPVVTIGGQQDVSRQSLERGTPGIDELIYLDLSGAYHAELDKQVINGSGASNQLLGILATAGIAAGTAFGAPVTVTLLNRKLAGAVAAVAGVGGGLTPRLIVMHPRRWGWLTGEVDSTGRPLVVPGAAGPVNAFGVNTNPGAYGDPGGDANPADRVTQTVGTLQGVPVTTDAAVPTNVGTLTEDVVAVLDTARQLLWEDGDGMPRQLRFEQPLGAQLAVKLVVYGYAAFTAARYPQAAAKFGGADTVGGNGLIAPTF